MQQQEIQAVREKNSYQTKIKLSEHSLADLKWWKENLLLENGKPLKIGMPQLIIKTDASKKRWGAVCQGTTTRGTWSYQERTKHINVLELTAVKLAILTFTREKIGNNNPLTNRQYNSSVLLGKNGQLPISLNIQANVLTNVLTN